MQYTTLLNRLGPSPCLRSSSALVAVGRVSLDLKPVHSARVTAQFKIIRRSDKVRERVWSLIVKSLHFANMPPKEDSVVGQRNDHRTDSNKVD